MAAQEKTFYIETFGCQMNVHDSEKVVGTLVSEGYRQVPTVEEADLVLYNTCSIRDKAEQKVFHRLHEFKKDAEAGQEVSACSAAWRSRRARRSSRRAPHVSPGVRVGVLPQAARRCWCRLEAGNRRVTGLDDRQTDEPSKPRSRARDNPHRAYITIIEGCDKSCAYCVVPFTRGPERSRTSESVLAEARQHGRSGLHRNSAARAERQQLRDPARAGRDSPSCWPPSARLPGIRRVRFTTSHPRDFGKDIVDAIDADPALCDHVHLPVQCGSTRVLDAMQRLYTRDEYMERIEWMKAAQARHRLTTDIIVGFPGETEADFERDARPARRSRVRFGLSLQVLAAAEYAGAAACDDAIPEEEKTRRLADPAGEAARDPEASQSTSPGSR